MSKDTAVTFIHNILGYLLNTLAAYKDACPQVLLIIPTSFSAGVGFLQHGTHGQDAVLSTWHQKWYYITQAN